MKTLFTHPFRRQYHWGYLVIACTLLISYGLWLGSMWYYDDWYDNGWKYMAKVGSHSATLLMCWAFILATRFRPVEVLFGGLDKVYKAHRYIGEAAFFLIFLHPIGLALMSWSDGQGFWRMLWFSADWARNTGIIALLIFSLLVTLSLYWKIRYHRWKRSHDFFGALLVLVIVHGVLAEGEIVRYPLLGIWFALFCGVGLLCYGYIRLLYRWLGPLHEYRVAEINHLADRIIELHLEPLGRPLRHEPGQFLYISLDSQAVSNEPHPFSISSAPESPTLRLSIKRLGDWTNLLEGISSGELARIWGPYGSFSEPLVEHPDAPLLLIGGGIGITPFLGMLASQQLNQHRGPILMIYSVASAERAVYLDELRSRCDTLPKLEVVLHVSNDEGFITTEYLRQQAANVDGDQDLTSWWVFVCGPQIMMDSIGDQLLAADLPIEHFISEDFAIR